MNFFNAAGYAALRWSGHLQDGGKTWEVNWIAVDTRAK